MSVAGAGDVNDDGWDDIIIGAPYYDSSYQLPDSGRATIYHGSAQGPTLSQVIFGTQGVEHLGYCVASARRANQDMYADVIIGAPNYSDRYVNEGRVYVYFGSSAGVSLSNPWIARSNQAYCAFGRSVRGGDIDMDYISEAIIGAPHYDVIDPFGNVQYDAGKVWIFGSSSGLPGGGPVHLPSEAIWSAQSYQAYSHCGYSLDYISRIYAAGTPGLVVGIPDYDHSGELENGYAVVWVYQPEP